MAFTFIPLDICPTHVSEVTVLANQFEEIEDPYGYLAEDSQESSELIDLST